MLTEYLKAAMGHAHYEILEDDGTYYGEIPDCPGVYANAATLEECRNELAGVLDRFFETVLVMAEDPAVRGNRIALLKALGRDFLALADLSKLQVEGDEKK